MSKAIRIAFILFSTLSHETHLNKVSHSKCPGLFGPKSSLLSGRKTELIVVAQSKLAFLSIDYQAPEDSLEQDLITADPPLITLDPPSPPTSGRRPGPHIQQSRMTSRQLQSADIPGPSSISMGHRAVNVSHPMDKYIYTFMMASLPLTLLLKAKEFIFVKAL